MQKSKRPAVDWNWLTWRSWAAAQVGAIILIAFMIGVGVAIFLNLRTGHNFLGTPDYAGFYAAAIILNEHDPSQLYDTDLQDRLLHDRVPGILAHHHYPYAHIPIVAYLLRPLALLSFPWSYAIWLIILAVLLVMFLVVCGTYFDHLAPLRRGLLLLSAAFLPLIMECWLAGQWSIIGCVWVATALWLALRHRMFVSGIVLALCLYKPTLMMYVLPIVVLSGRLKLLAGVTVGGFALVVLSFLIVGEVGSQSYMELLLGYQQTMADGAEQFKVFKHVDLNSFLIMLYGERDALSKTIFIAIAGIYSVFLLYAWWFRTAQSCERIILALCATLTGNLIFSAYTPIYDVSLLIPNVLITLEMVNRIARKQQQRWLMSLFGILACLLYFCSWMTQVSARTYSFQPLTILLLIWGGAQLALLLRHNGGALHEPETAVVKLSGPELT